MNYIVFEEDGRISQSSKVFNPTREHEERMRELGQNFIRLKSSGFLPIGSNYVKTDGRRPVVAERPDMSPQINAKIVKAATQPFVILKLPRPCVVVLTTGGYELVRTTVTDGEVEFIPPVPALYTVTVEAFPHKVWRQTLEAVA